jgi:hypothetical protein
LETFLRVALANENEKNKLMKLHSGNILGLLYFPPLLFRAIRAQQQKVMKIKNFARERKKNLPKSSSNSSLKKTLIIILRNTKICGNEIVKTNGAGVSVNVCALRRITNKQH